MQYTIYFSQEKYKKYIHWCIPEVKHTYIWGQYIHIYTDWIDKIFWKSCCTTLIMWCTLLLYHVQGNCREYWNAFGWFWIAMCCIWLCCSSYVVAYKVLQSFGTSFINWFLSVVLLFTWSFSEEFKFHRSFKIPFLRSLNLSAREKWNNYQFRYTVIGL